MSGEDPTAGGVSLPVRAGHLVSGVVRGIVAAEVLVHLVVGALLVVLGIVLVSDAVHQVLLILDGSRSLSAVVLRILEQTLLLFIVAELLHTVAIAIEHGSALDPVPFLVVGLVAAIRRVLVLTAEAEQSFRWDPEGIELLILMALILVMATTVLVWQRAQHVHDRPPGRLSPVRRPWRATGRA